MVQRQRGGRLRVRRHGVQRSGGGFGGRCAGMRRVQRRWDEEERQAPTHGERRQHGRLHGGHVEQQRHAAPAAEARWRGRDNAIGRRRVV
jgi:hypothetical protein